MSSALQEKEVIFKSTDARPDRIASSNPDDFAVPKGREEEWRYTPLKRVLNLHSDAQATTDVVFEFKSAPEVKCALVKRSEIKSTFLATDRISARTQSLWANALVVEIPADAQAKEITWITAKLLKGTQFSHLLIHAKSNSKATIVLDHVGSGTAGINCEVILEAGANIDLINIFDLSRESVLATEQQFLIGKDASLKTLAVQLGGDVVRYVPRAKFSNTHGSIDLFGVFLATDGQYFENRVFVDHNKPDCRSNVLYRGGAHGKGSHTVWIGDVLIRKIATGTDTYEMNRNLLLDDGARADSVPNLEIETGEIQKAGHASVTGRLDDDQLFYLMSRGIDEDVAKQLVIEGFFSGIFGEFNNQELKEKLSERLNTAIERTHQ
jgi:Fe-S cluster assembly protein SufD